ncbi:DUF2867 domain-containing protein [Pseudonocardia sp. HH130630-07]|uniref:DUF2867 domain-containing protein n=1 Tax=Pseudonocardia sp. HH130630-07 TaxID=1690815 RepID=UPI0008150EE0|nr:DUF2867 domain-containing protein [Pseudonocardia sp. HH130630-07]ANY07769.1 hypothetical protein AFB00_17355 [Pseudonocardia sp. HH130630-07]
MTRRIDIPQHVTTMQLLDRIDYGDAFTADVPPGALDSTRAAEHAQAIARQVMPRWMTAAVLAIHRHVLGLQLTTSDQSSLLPGWRLLRHDPDTLAYGVTGGLITPRVVLVAAPEQLIVTTVVRYDHRATPAVWALVAPLHRLVVRFVLARTARRATTATTSGHRPR